MPRHTMLRARSLVLVASLLTLALVGVVIERRSPSAERPRFFEREPSRDEGAVGIFRFFLPPGYRAVSGRSLDALVQRLERDDVAYVATCGAGGRILRAFESEDGEFRILFSSRPRTPEDELLAGRAPEEARWSAAVQRGEFTPQSRVGTELDIAGLPATVSTLFLAGGGGIKVYDFDLSQDPLRRHTLAIRFERHEDDGGGRLAAFLQSLRVEGR